MKIQSRYLIAGFLILSSLSCTEKLEESSIYLGPEVSYSSVLSELDESVSTKSPKELQTGEASLYEKNYRIELGPVSKSGETLTYVYNRTETDDRIQLVLKQEETDFTSPDHPKKVTESAYEFAKEKAVERPSTTDILPLWMRVEPFSLFLDAEPPQNAVTFHNLKTKITQVELPLAVLEKPNCMGFVGCRVNARETSVDMVFWSCPQPSQCPRSFDKMQWSWLRSPQTPFLATDINICRHYVVDPPTDNSNRKYFVRECEVLLDFGFKTPTD